jgi:hypothetical protein
MSDAEVGAAAGAARIRGPERLLPATQSPVLPRCAAVAVGSVPHTDPREAVALVQRLTPDIPSWPQLPRRSFRENMYVQFSGGLPGLVVDEECERVFVRDEVAPEELVVFLERVEHGDPAVTEVDERHSAGLAAFGEMLTGQSPPFVKGQVTGPISFGLAVPREDRRALYYDDTMREVAGTLLQIKARRQVELLRAWAPGSLPLIMVDEPYLTQMGSAFVSIPEEQAVDHLAGFLRGLSCLRGLHVCGGSDWTLLSGLPVDVLNFDAADHSASLFAHAEAVARFVAEGGLLAWGIVPNDERAVEADAAGLGKAVLAGAEALAATGLVEQAEVLLRSFVSPACGTGTLTVELAECVLTRAAEASSWLRDRAL